MVWPIIVLSLAIVRCFATIICLTTLLLLFVLHLTPLTEVRLLSPSLIVCLRIEVIFHIGYSFKIEWACIGVQGAYASHIM